MVYIITFVEKIRDEKFMFSFRRFAIINAAVCVYSMHEGAILFELTNFFLIQRLFTFTTVTLYMIAVLALNQHENRQ